MGAQTGKETGENAAQHQKGQISEDAWNLGQEKGYGYLPYIVGDSPEDAGQTQIMAV